MAKLIDRDSYRRKLENAICRNLRIGRPNPVVLMALKYAIATLDSEPVVDAVPVSFIQKRISYLQEIADYEFEASGGYTGEASTQLFELRRLILGWSMREKADNKKSYFPKGFFSKERPLAKGEEDESD